MVGWFYGAGPIARKLANEPTPRVGSPFVIISTDSGSSSWTPTPWCSSAPRSAAPSPWTMLPTTPRPCQPLSSSTRVAIVQGAQSDLPARTSCAPGEALGGISRRVPSEDVRLTLCTAQPDWLEAYAEYLRSGCINVSSGQI